MTSKAADLAFGILGPLDVTRGGTPVPVNGPKLRVVLAALLLRPNATVSVDRLAEKLWGDEQPPTARISHRAEHEYANIFCESLL